MANCSLPSLVRGITVLRVPKPYCALEDSIEEFVVVMLEDAWRLHRAIATATTRYHLKAMLNGINDGADDASNFLVVDEMNLLIKIFNDS